MIPAIARIRDLWEKYRLPEQKRIHLTAVAKLAMIFADKIPVNKKLLFAAALLHDVDKAVGGRHPETAVAILRQEGMDEVADVVATHSLHSILGARPPKTREQKLLFLADKMVKYDIVGVDKRFALWRAENLPPDAQKILDQSYPKVKALEQEVFNLAKLRLRDILSVA